MVGVSSLVNLFPCLIYSYGHAFLGLWRAAHAYHINCYQILQGVPPSHSFNPFSTPIPNVCFLSSHTVFSGIGSSHSQHKTEWRGYIASRPQRGNGPSSNVKLTNLYKNLIFHFEGHTDFPHPSNYQAILVHRYLCTCISVHVQLAQ